MAATSRRTSSRSLQRLPLMVLLCAQVVLLAGVGLAWAANGDKVEFDVIVSGHFKGDGWARINPANKLHIHAKVSSEEGGSLTLNLPNISGVLRDVSGGVAGTFSLTDTLDGKTLTVNGKVEPATEDSEARLTATYVFDGDKVGRIVGHAVGSKKPKNKGGTGNGGGNGNGNN
jgi:uncharacterized protein YfaP (DUF2135 family)